MTTQSKIPDVVRGLVTAQNNADVEAFAQHFTTDAIVYDEGKTHQGIQAIKAWNKKTTEEYQTHLNVLDFSTSGQESILTVQVSGNFDGSPIQLDYHLEITQNKISSLRITG